ncbi:unnamed protein product, partial [Gulo gulo]
GSVWSSSSSHRLRKLAVGPCGGSAQVRPTRTGLWSWDATPGQQPLLVVGMCVRYRDRRSRGSLECRRGGP